MKFRKKLLLAGLFCILVLAGCGGKGTVENVSVTETQPEQQQENADMSYEDNFSVKSEDAAQFGKQIQEAVKTEDLKALAGLVSYPVYVGLPGAEGIVETKEDFLALGAQQIFTQDLIESVTSADTADLTPSEAGFILSDESGRPNIIFGVVNGRLAITGINY